jgi:hypothetical protein
MSTNDTHQDDVKLEKITLDDGRQAEKRIVVDATGNEVVEVYAEEKRAFKLETRIVRETKNIVIKEVHQTLKDGVVDHEVVYALDPDILASVSSLTEKVQEPVKACSVLKAQEVAESNVDNKKKERLLNGVLVAVVVLQAAFLLGYLLMR